MVAFSETDRLKALFAGDSFEISRNPLTLETRSRNTAENASFTKELVKPNPGERWPLVSRVRMDRPVGLLDNGQTPELLQAP